MTDPPARPWIVRDQDGAPVETYDDDTEAHKHAERIGGTVWPDLWVQKNPQPKKKPWQKEQR